MTELCENEPEREYAALPPTVWSVGPPRLRPRVAGPPGNFLAAERHALNTECGALFYGVARYGYLPKISLRENLDGKRAFEASKGRIVVAYVRNWSPPYTHEKSQAPPFE